MLLMGASLLLDALSVVRAKYVGEKRIGCLKTRVEPCVQGLDARAMPAACGVSPLARLSRTLNHFASTIQRLAFGRNPCHPVN
jgi:hypothetical protein